MFVQGRTYRRRDLHREHGGQRQGGISTPAGRGLILLFTGEMGLQYGYEDGWTEEGLFLYTGEGQRGDMMFVRGNRAVRDHVADGKDLHLFAYVSPGYVRYVGPMVCTGFHQRLSLDLDGRERQVIVFELAPVGAFGEGLAPQADEEGLEAGAASLTTLRERAMASASYGTTPRERLTVAHARSAAVRAYVLARANGHCEGCGEAAPFRTGAGQLYLETHHIRRLSDAGLDDPRWVVALCPNCHRRAHYGADGAAFNRRLAGIVEHKEMALNG